ncbi:MAG: hypothetical protein JST12_00040 [Armatimonadetes bacterium]|nr:hypothetical protein [Armatimonadota bacterium]
MKRFRKVWLSAGVALALSGAGLVACIYPNYNSVHFNSAWTYQDKVIDFGRVPQEVMVNNWSFSARRGVNSYFDQVPPVTPTDDWDGSITADYPKAEDYSLDDTERFKIMAFENSQTQSTTYDDYRQRVHHARHLEVQGRFREAADLFAKTTNAVRIQSFVVDRRELIQEGLTANSKGYAKYLRDRYLIEYGSDLQKADCLTELKTLEADPRLKPHIEYVLACENLKSDHQNAARALLALADKYPNSPRAEAALVMAGRSYFDVEFDPEGSQVSFAIFDRLLQRYPKTRFRDSIEGLRGAYCLRVKRNIVAAIDQYVTQSHSSMVWQAIRGEQNLAEVALEYNGKANSILHWLRIRSIAPDAHTRYNASHEIRKILFVGMDVESAKELQRRLRRDPQLLESYLDFRIEDTTLTPKQERNLLDFAEASIDEHARSNRGIIGRIGQMMYNQGRYSHALAMARVAKTAPGDIAERARYLEASCLVRLGQPHEAMRLFDQLYRTSREYYIRNSVGEYLAFLNEKYGSALRAYELYRDIAYDEDRYFVADSVMSPEELKVEISRVANRAERGALRYTLAMRYFRVNRFDEAKEVLEGLPKEWRMAKGIDMSQSKSNAEYFKRDLLDDIDPLDDVKTMAALHNRSLHGTTAKARAEALYAMAQYAKKRRLLMYYSAGLWQGGRTDAYSVFWNTLINKGLSQERAMRSAFEHECDAHVIEYCEELVRRYPNSKLVPKALYSAGVAYETLSRFNSFWEDDKDRLLKKGIRLMTRLNREYPDDALARAARKYAAVWKAGDTPEY